MDIPKELLDSFSCKWEEKYFHEFNQELVGRGIEPITYEAYYALLQQEAVQDDSLAQSPRVR